MWKQFFVYFLTWEELKGIDMFIFSNERADGKADAKGFLYGNLKSSKKLYLPQKIYPLLPYYLVWKSHQVWGFLCQEIISITFLLK